MPPLTEAYLSLAVLLYPPLTEEWSPLAVLPIPPLTEAKSPEIVLFLGPTSPPKLEKLFASPNEMLCDPVRLSPLGLPSSL